MGKVEIKVPDDGWFRGESKFRPQDKQLCVVVLNKIINLPLVCLFLEKDCVFLDIRSIKKQNSKTDKHETETVSYVTMNWDGVEYWKPLSLPEGTNERVMNMIEKICKVLDIK